MRTFRGYKCKSSDSLVCFEYRKTSRFYLLREFVGWSLFLALTLTSRRYRLMRLLNIYACASTIRLLNSLLFHMNDKAPLNCEIIKKVRQHSYRLYLCASDVEKSVIKDEKETMRDLNEANHFFGRYCERVRVALKAISVILIASLLICINY